MMIFQVSEESMSKPLILFPTFCQLIFPFKLSLPCLGKIDEIRFDSDVEYGKLPETHQFVSCVARRKVSNSKNRQC